MTVTLKMRYPSTHLEKYFDVLRLISHGSFWRLYLPAASVLFQSAEIEEIELSE
jgi:hypothetical protein